MTLAVPGATGFVALAQRAVIGMTVSPDRRALVNGARIAPPQNPELVPQPDRYATLNLTQVRPVIVAYLAHGRGSWDLWDCGASLRT